MTITFSKKSIVCSVCELSDVTDLITCDGQCQRTFHKSCFDLKFNQYPISDKIFKCLECTNNIFQCLVCKSDTINNHKAKKCSINGCGRYFHESCIQKLDQSLVKAYSETPFVCPSHKCKKCLVDSHFEERESDSNRNNKSSGLSSRSRLLRCMRCPSSYHATEECIVAGTILLGGYNIICPNHFKPISKDKDHRIANVPWCFACCKFNEVICCSRCPASYHFDCIEEPNEELLYYYKNLIDKTKTHPKSSNNQSTNQTYSDKEKLKKNESLYESIIKKDINSSSSAKTLEFELICSNCQFDKRPAYGEIVWAKVGQYRFWPAKVIHPRTLPENLLNRWHTPGEFPVKFFGTYDYYWINIGKCFSFDESDNCDSFQLTNLNNAFSEGVKEARDEITKMKDKKRSCLPSFNSKNPKSNFQYIRTNKPFGNVIVHRLQLTDYPHCDCDPKSANPCGTDDCVNRVMKYECHPALCPAGERCQNQRFVKRLYPKQDPIFTGSRGWGLIAKTHIKKGDFVNEYVGELIDEEECKRRLNEAHEKNITNFYFLTIDKERIIDAGPKGNFARFMNHSCDPNVQTQKWIVNGDVRVGLFALKDIETNTELTFNYNLDCLSNQKAECKCGAINCSGYIGERPKSIINGSISTTVMTENIEDNNILDDKKKKKRKLSESNIAFSKQNIRNCKNLTEPDYKKSYKVRRANTISESDSGKYKRFRKSNI